VAKFETVPIGELKHRLPVKLLPLVEECVFRSSRSVRSEHRDHADRRIMIGAERR
jgi:hypothetical protein